METTDEIFIDTSAFKALIDKRDDFYLEAVEIWKKIQKEDIMLVTSNYILDETFTLIRSKRNLELVLDFRDNILKSTPILRIERVIVEDEANGWRWFLNNWKGLSFTDCVSFAMMKRLKINRVATFDQHFKKAGMKIESA